MRWVFDGLHHAYIHAELLYLGRDYPQGYDFFRPRLHRAFMAKAHLTDEKEIREAIARAEFVRKGKVFFFFSLDTLSREHPGSRR